MRDVTPIKVRGKKSKSLKPNKKNGAHIEYSIPRKRLAGTDTGSPGARSNATSRGSRPSSGQNTPHRIVQSYAPPRHSLSSVEQLPTEILEQIFLYALNVSFARSSHIIGTKLSSQHTYYAFGQAIFGFFKDQYGNRYTTYDALTDIPDNLLVKARNEALLCRWMTGVMFRALQDSKLLTERARLDTVFSHQLQAYEVSRNKLIR